MKARIPRKDLANGGKLGTEFKEPQTIQAYR
jgi:hypothetical protein